MTDYFLCCFYYNRQSESRHGSSSKFPLRNIDKSMIGLPTNFTHTAHIGCSDLSPTSNSNPINLSVPGLIQQSILHRGSQQSNDSQVNYRNQYMHHQQPILAHMKLIDLKSS